ncbi:hypothetical protein [Halomicrococcus sp. NG-SE-24]|uniref:hypothetical protein n=1 Tax=Halomicrococcus sp. NG-SE-24 TaxID=3436928 RepID=UPI003D964344
MTEPFELDVDSTETVAERRDEVVARVRDHAGQIARELARLQGGDYGQRTFGTDDGEWTVKYEAGDLQYLRFDGGRGETYVVSTKRQPEPEALAAALADYDAFVASYNRYVASLDGVLDDVSADFPAVESTDAVVSERDRILERVREATDRMAHELSRYEGGDYGTFSTRVSGTRWELKWDGDGASYLRVGGEGGVYLLSQYEPPSTRDVRELAGEFAAFVEAFNAHVDGLESDLSHVSL